MELVWSFHDNMETSVRVDGELLEEFKVTMACDKGARWPLRILFNLYACIVSERWAETVKDITYVGTLMLCKQDNHLF